MKEFKEQEVYNAVKAGFMAYKDLARIRIAQTWDKKSPTERVAAARALVYLGRVARNPAEYFSRIDTEEDWMWRANEYAKEKGMRASYAFYIVPNPTVMVLNNVTPLFEAGTSADFFYFCSLVQKWEYNRTDNKAASDFIAAQSANRLMSLSERVQGQARKMVQFSQVMKPVAQVKRGIMALVRGNRQK